MKKNKVLCFGELLLRLSPSYANWIKDAQMPVYIGGAELNTATALAHWGVPVAFCSALPDHELAAEICAALARRHIDTGPILPMGDRISTYFLPAGTDMKSEGVIYDRKHSAFSELKPGLIPWAEVFKGVSWFHFSAICPAPNEHIAAVCQEALAYASAHNITISVDLNYRAKLWQSGRDPQHIMPSLVQYCDVVMGNIWAVERMLNIPIEIEVGTEKQACLIQSKKTSEALMEAFPRCRRVALTFRFDSDADATHYYATLYDGRELHYSYEYQAEDVVDRVGSGDCFMAGLIYANLFQWRAEQVVEFAAAAAFDKLFQPGDTTATSVSAIKALVRK